MTDKMADIESHPHKKAHGGGVPLSDFPPSVVPLLAAFDADGDGTIDHSELAAAAQMYKESLTKNKKLVRVVSIMSVVGLAVLAAMFGLVWAVVVLTKNTSLAGKTTSTLTTRTGALLNVVTVPNTLTRTLDSSLTLDEITEMGFLNLNNGDYVMSAEIVGAAKYVNIDNVLVTYIYTTMGGVLINGATITIDDIKSEPSINVALGLADGQTTIRRARRMQASTSSASSISDGSSISTTTTTSTTTTEEGVQNWHFNQHKVTHSKIKVNNPHVGDDGSDSLTDINTLYFGNQLMYTEKWNNFQQENKDYDIPLDKFVIGVAQSDVQVDSVNGLPCLKSSEGYGFWDIHYNQWTFGEKVSCAACKDADFCAFTVCPSGINIEEVGALTSDVSVRDVAGKYCFSHSSKPEEALQSLRDNCEKLGLSSQCVGK